MTIVWSAEVNFGFQMEPHNVVTQPSKNCHIKAYQQIEFGLTSGCNLVPFYNGLLKSFLAVDLCKTDFLGDCEY